MKIGKIAMQKFQHSNISKGNRRPETHPVMMMTKINCPLLRREYVKI
jgi:hypothetical protein